MFYCTTKGALVELAASNETIIMTSFLSCLSSLLKVACTKVLNNDCNVLENEREKERELNYKIKDKILPNALH